MRSPAVALLAPALLAASTWGAAAQQLVLRSGAHEGFDRLVIPFERPVDWHLGRRGGEYALAVTPAPGLPAPAYDLSQVFLRIRPDRLAGLRRDPDGALRLRLACACHASAFRFGPGWIVVDIADGPPPPDSLFEVSLGPAEPGPVRPRARPAAPPALPLRLPDVAMPAALVPATGDGAPVLQSEAPAAPPTMEIAAPDLAGPPAADTSDDLEERISGGVAQARAELLADLDRAATQGLITIASATPGPSGPVRRRALPPGPAAPDPGQPPQLDAITAVDAVRIVAEGAGEPPPAPADCPPPGRLDIAAWGTVAPVAAQLGAARGALLEEFDRPQPDAVRRLARLYLHFGFGAETTRLLDAFALPQAEAAELRRLAVIVDFPDTASARGLAPLPGCPGPAAMWDLLVQPAVGALGPDRLRDALATFGGLPAHLRRHLGPPIAARLAEAGREDAARAVLAAIARADAGARPGPAPVADAARLAAARLADTEVADDDLARIAAGNGPQAAAALMALAERHLDRGEAPPAALRAHLGALAFELRGSAPGAALKALEIRAMAAQGAHAAAFSALAEAESGSMRHAPLPSGTLPALLRQLFAGAGDAVLAETYFRHRARIDAAALDPGLRRQGAGRMLAAGLPEPAWTILHPPGREPAAAADEDRLLGAEILLAQGAAELALEHVADVEGAGAAALRLRIAEARGDLAAAQEAARAIGEPALVARADLRAADWLRLRQTGPDSVRRAISLTPELLAGEAPGADAEPFAAPAEAAGAPGLAAARAALARSRTARDTLDALLAEIPPPES